MKPVNLSVSHFVCLCQFLTWTNFQARTSKFGKVINLEEETRMTLITTVITGKARTTRTTVATRETRTTRVSQQTQKLKIDWFHQYLVLRYILKLYLVHFEGYFTFNTLTQKAPQFEPASQQLLCSNLRIPGDLNFSKVTGKGSPTSQPSGNFWLSCDCFWVSCDCFWIKILISFLQDFEIILSPDPSQSRRGGEEERQVRDPLIHLDHEAHAQRNGVSCDCFWVSCDCFCGFK